MGASFPVHLMLAALLFRAIIPHNPLSGSLVPLVFGGPILYGISILGGPRLFKRWLRSGEDGWVWGLAMGVGFCGGMGAFLYFTGAFKSWPPRGEKHEVLYWVPPILVIHAIACRTAWALFGIRHPR